MTSVCKNVADGQTRWHACPLAAAPHSSITVPARNISVVTNRKSVTEVLGYNLITVQHDATYSVNYISVGSSTCFGC